MANVKSEESVYSSDYHSRYLYESFRGLKSGESAYAYTEDNFNELQDYLNTKDIEYTVKRCEDYWVFSLVKRRKQYGAGKKQDNSL